MHIRTAIVALLAATVPVFAHADTLTESFLTGPFSSQDGRVTLLVAGFNPSLGTLTSVSASFSGAFTGTISAGAGAGGFSFEVDVAKNPGYTQLARSIDDLLRGPNGNPIVSDTVDESGSRMSSAAVLSEASGVNTDPFSFAYGTTQDNISSTGLTGSIVFTYTPNAPTPPPVATTPEPSSIALLGTGLLGVAGLVRRRRVECRGVSCGSPARC